MKSFFSKQLFLGLVIGLFAVPSFSQSPNPPKASPSKEQREQMAKAHEKMATCLRSNKSMSECHEEMHSMCENMGHSCEMKEGHEHGKKGTGKH